MLLEQESHMTPQEISPWLSRQRLEIIFTLITLVSSLTAFFGNNIGLSAEIIAGLYVLAFLCGGYYGLLDAISLLKAGNLDVNLLMILAALGAAAIGQPAEGATLLFLFSLSNTLQAYSMDRSRRAIANLLDLRPSQADVRRGANWVNVPVEELVIDDNVRVRPGERFPIDGNIITGSSMVDQSPITGESIPVFKQTGDPVFAGTVNGNGAVEVLVTHTPEDSTLARIVQMVEEAQGSKAKTQRTLDRFEQYYSIAILLSTALLILIPYLFLGESFKPAFYRGMILLVVASPCALVISTPASILSAIANGARNGVLFKGGAHLESTAGIKIVAFDKTGTLTTGQPGLQTLIPYGDTSSEELLKMAAAAESHSEHLLAKSIMRAAEEQGLDIPATGEFQAVPGHGVEAEIEGSTYLVGNPRLFELKEIKIPADLTAQVGIMENKGETLILAYGAGKWLGALGVADTLRSDAGDHIRALKKLGVQHVVMLTGDHSGVAKNIAAQAGVDEYYADLLPQDKVRILKELQEKYGAAAMVGDGVNDAPALATAEVGIAMGGAGTDVALETADVVLMADNLANLPHAIGLAKKAQRVVWQNLAFSIAVIIILIVGTFAAGLSLPLGVVGHEGSTVIVVLNGLRLLGYRPKI
ncbi:MAG: heavy metal translocating P-type ATPase [Anaerolineae bacterium]|nr:heavy metal translocating P-type ATPase [Anaerolineae bacterium]